MNFNSILIGPYLIETDLEQVRGTVESEGFSVVSENLVGGDATTPAGCCKD